MPPSTSKLSKHFSLAELTVTSSGLANTPPPTALASLQRLCANVLESVRSHYGKAVLVHSGYRSPEVNAAAGGSKRSQHMKGEAADFHVDGYTVHEVAVWISENLDYDQLILENFVPGIKTSGWVHCSYAADNRNQDLTKFKGSATYYPGIVLTPQEAAADL